MIRKINDFLVKNKNYSSPIVRIGLAFVLLWFGFNQLFNPEAFLGYLPEWVLPNHSGMMGPMMTHMYNAGFQADNFIIFNGILDSLIGFFLLIGFYTRIFGLVAAFHLSFIAFSLGYNDVAIRDVGLVAMAVSLVFSGAGRLSFDNRKKN